MKRSLAAYSALATEKKRFVPWRWRGSGGCAFSALPLPLTLPLILPNVYLIWRLDQEMLLCGEGRLEEQMLPQN